MNSEEALKSLVDGNARYAAGKPSHIHVSPELRSRLYSRGQSPYAAIVGCSDSRVPMELIFDAGLGELFIIRTAGNVVGDIGLGSLEYAVEALRTPLIAVIGHQECGAVKAAIHGSKFSKSMQVVIDEICRCSDSDICTCNQEEIEDRNILHTLSKIALNPIISKAVGEGSLLLVAGKYSLETGIVTFFQN
ncbi:MAG: carbonic anhydrase [Treponema sp.]|nr:carbonic anhydrase [Treponema sp.]